MKNSCQERSLQVSSNSMSLFCSRDHFGAGILHRTPLKSGLGGNFSWRALVSFQIPPASLEVPWGGRGRVWQGLSDATAPTPVQSERLYLYLPSPLSALFLFHPFKGLERCTLSSEVGKKSLAYSESGLKMTYPFEHSPFINKKVDHSKAQTA